MPLVRKGFKALPEEELQTSFEKAAEFGFDFLEVPLHPVSECRRIEQRAKSIVAAAEETGIEILVHLPHKPRDVVCVGSADADRRTDAIKEIRQAVVTASKLGASTAVLHVEAPEAHLVETDEMFLFDVLDSLTDFGRSNSIEICYENLSRRYPTLADFPQLLEETAVSITVDTGHARVNGYSSAEIASFVFEHSDRIEHVHLNDTRGPKDEHLPFGAGTIDFELILGALRETDWNGSMTTEVKTHDYDYIRLGKEKLDAII